MSENVKTTENVSYEKGNLDLDAMKALAEQKIKNDGEDFSGEETHVVGQDLAALFADNNTANENTEDDSGEFEEEVDKERFYREESKETPDKVDDVEESIEDEAVEEVTEETDVPATESIKVTQPETVKNPNLLNSGEEILGVVVDNKDLEEKKQPAIGDLGPQVLEAVKEYEDEMEQDIDRLANYKEQIVAIMKEKGIDVTNPDMMKAARQRLLSAGVDVNNIEAIKNSTVDFSDIIAGETTNVNASQHNDDIVDNSEQEFNDKYNEAVVLIDKIGMGTVINFSENERAKMEKSKVIKLKEIEDVRLKSIHVKKAKDSTPIEQILKRGKKAFTTNIACVASGYTAVMRGGSSYEIIEILKDAQNYVLDIENKWRLIYEKIEFMSIGKPDTFEEWLSITAAADYNVFIYGILVATYPEEDSITFSCENPDCKKIHYEFEHRYDTRSLLRAEKMSETFKEKFQATVDNSYTVEAAKAYAENAPVNNVRRIELPVTGYVVDLCVQSAYDYIHSSIQSLSGDDVEEKYKTVAILSTSVKNIFVPDIDGGLDENGDYEYFAIEDPMEIIKTLYTLTDRDLAICNEMSDRITSDITFEFGMMNIECPRCHRKTLEYAMRLDNILFQRLQHATDITLE